MSHAREQIIFDPAGISLIAEITKDALRHATSLGINIASNDQEGRRLLAKRIICAIFKLGENALLPTLD